MRNFSSFRSGSQISDCITEESIDHWGSISIGYTQFVYWSASRSKQTDPYRLGFTESSLTTEDDFPLFRLLNTGWTVPSRIWITGTDRICLTDSESNRYGFLLTDTDLLIVFSFSTYRHTDSQSNREWFPTDLRLPTATCPIDVGSNIQLCAPTSTSFSIWGSGFRFHMYSLVSNRRVWVMCLQVEVYIWVGSCWVLGLSRGNSQIGIRENISQIISRIQICIWGGVGWILVCSVNSNSYLTSTLFCSQESYWFLLVLVLGLCDSC